MYDPNPGFDPAPECGCRFDSETGIPIRSCPQHDKRDRATRMAALFQKLALNLEMAAGLADPSEALRDAAKVCVELSRAVLGERAAEPLE